MTARASRLAPHGFFVTGTDTGVGKTLVGCALLYAFAALGKSVIGMKPVAAGAARHGAELFNDDVTMLRAASNVEAPPALVNPYCFERAIAPHLAARHARVTLDIATITGAFERLASMADVVVVEGVGGFCVPLNDCADSADLAQQLGLPVILVVGMRLGCLNHALLTAQAVRARGLSLAGWVANCIDPGMAALAENTDALAVRLAAPLIGEIEFSAPPDARRIARQLDSSPLVQTR